MLFINLRDSHNEVSSRPAEKIELYALLEQGMEDIRQGRVIPAGEAISEIRKDLTNGILSS